MKNGSDFISFGKPDFSDKEIDALTRTLRTGWVGMGPETQAFEKELSEALGAPHVITVNSCTSALFLSLLVLGIGPGDEVITPSFTWCAAANAALYLGATPVFCDIDPITLCATQDSIKEKLSSRTKAVIPVHFAGRALEVEKIRSALPPRVHLIEDAAHAFGAKFNNGQPVGSSENLTCFSFYANKNLSTGEGGAIALADGKIADRLRSLRQNALPLDAWKRYNCFSHFKLSGITELGYKMNYTDLQACIGRVQLRRQTEFKDKRIKIAKRYFDYFSLTDAPFSMQAGILDPYHALHLFTVQICDPKISRDDFVRWLRKHRIGAGVHYLPLHLMPLYKASAQKRLKNCEAVFQRILTLPIGPSMTMAEVDYVVTQMDNRIRETMLSEDKQN